MPAPARYAKALYLTLDNTHASIRKCGKTGGEPTLSDHVVELKHVTKRFPGVIAMSDMHLGIRPGEIHGLIGENGAGKSTLIKVLTGVYIPEEGEILVNGAPVCFKNPVQARKAGIACVYQELNIVPQLSVADNIFIGRALKHRSGLLNYREMHKVAHEVLSTLGHPEINTRMECGKLGIGLQQMIEIAKAVSLDCRLLIMDEPTSSLGKQEIVQLMATVRELSGRGIAVLFVSHKLEELFELCDRVSVMRDGCHIITDDIANMTPDSLIHAMVGRTIENLYPKAYATRREVFIEAKNLCSPGVLHNVSFAAHGGEILGFAGLVGAGRTETMRALFGADPSSTGEIFVRGNRVSIKRPEDAIKQRIAFLTEDRKGQGLVLSEPVKTNLIMANLRRFRFGPFLRDKAIAKTSRENVAALRIKTPTINEVVAQLSGGNQQKVVIGKWMNSDCDIFIFDEPTRGIDVGAKIEVYNVMNELVKDGKCVIMLSSEMPEILAMSDRVVVMRTGRVMAQIERDSPHFNQEDIMKAAWGGEIA